MTILHFILFAVGWRIIRGKQETDSAEPRDVPPRSVPSGGRALGLATTILNSTRCDCEPVAVRCWANRLARYGRTILGGILALGLLLLFGCSERREVSDRVQLVVSTEVLTPGSTFELRFEETMVDRTNAARPGTSPLLIEPTLRGTYAWLSERSGIFTPLEPTRLGTEYRFSLRPGLRDASGRPLRAKLARTLRTPSFSVEAMFLPDGGRTNLPANVQVQLQFNADIYPAAAQSFLEFRNRAGLRVAARLRPLGADLMLTPEQFSRLTWKGQFPHGADPATPPVVAPAPTADFRRPTDHGNHFLVSPATPLAIGRDWRLVVLRGLPSVERALRLPSTHEIKLGDVIPFTVAEALARNTSAEGKRIHLLFSKQLSGDLNSSNVLDWISVQPTPSNLTARLTAQTVDLFADYQLHQSYTVAVRSGLPSGDSLQISETMEVCVDFTPLPPRLYFPAFTVEQHGEGRREFELMTVNTDTVRLRARQLDRHTLIHALRGYQSYFKPYDRSSLNENEPHRQIDFNLVPGRTIYDRQISPTGRTDELRRVTLKWDDILGPGKRGAVFLCAEQLPGGSRTDKLAGTEVLVQLTDLGMTWKPSAKSNVVFLFSHSTGRPVTNASVSLLTEDGDAVAENRTDAQGLAFLPMPTNGLWLMAQSGEDLHARRVEEDLLSLYRFNVRYDELGYDSARRQMLLFTDRPVYRPGETVHLKGVARDLESVGHSIPTATTNRLRLINPKGETLLDTNIILSTLGSFAESVILPDGPRGYHWFEVQGDKGSFTHGFQVADVQANAFAIQLIAKPHYTAEEPVITSLSASYYMGAPLSKARVRWSAEVADMEFKPEGFEQFQFGTGWIDERLGRGRSAFTVSGEADYFGQTNLIIAPEIPPNAKAPQPRSVRLRAEVTDLNQQTLSQTTEFIRHSSEFYLGLKRNNAVLPASEAFDTTIVAVRADGTPVDDPMPVTLTVQRLDYHTVRMEGAGRSALYRSEVIATNVFASETRTASVRKAEAGWVVAATTSGDAQFTPNEPGQYLIEARATDTNGRAVVTAATYYVRGPGEMAWAYRNQALLEMVTDRKSYQPGESATLLIKAPFSGTALVTVERDEVLRSFVTELTGNTPSIQLPLEENDAPNVFVSVMLIRGATASPKKIQAPEYRLGYCRLTVESKRDKLNISMRAAQSEYRPGEYIHATALVNDYEGRGVPNAEVTLYAVDEGMLSLTGYPTPNPYEFFHQPRPLNVRCGVSLPLLLTEDPDQLSFQNKGYLIGGGSARERVRRDFVPCAFWNATLVSDAAGRVETKFRAPDSLTRYRIIAVAHTAHNQFGSGEASVEVNKPLMIDPALPKFATITDKLLARAVVHNRTHKSGMVEVLLQADDKARAGGSSRRVKVAAQASTTIEFPVEFIDVGASKWIWRARFVDDLGNAAPDTVPAGVLQVVNRATAEPFTDSVESTISVNHLAPVMREILSSRIDAKETNLLAGANPALLEGRGKVTVTLSNTRLVELGEAISHLLHYPYGCVEQTSSSLMPWIVVRNSPAVGWHAGKTPAEMDKAITAGVQRLLSMQTDSGGLSYWPGAQDPMLWGSAYGGLVLGLAQRSGMAIPVAAQDRLLKYLSAQLRSAAEAKHSWNLAEHCLALYTLAMAGRAEPAYHEMLFRRRDQLSPEDRALLALAILESLAQGRRTEPSTRSSPSAPHENQMAAELLRISVTGSPTHHPFGSDARRASIQLLAWCRLRPDDPSVDRLVAELTRAQVRAHWGTTQGNAWALYALSEYAAKVEDRLAENEGVLNWGGHSETFTLSSRGAMARMTFDLTPKLASQPLKLSNPAGRRLFTQVAIEARAQTTGQGRMDRGFSIRRTYQELDDENVPHEANELRVGDRVLVTLTLDVPEAARYVAVDDALPAILEPINSALKSQESLPAPAGTVTNDFPWFNDFQEFRADRALFFRNELAAGRYTIQYLTRVRAAGVATAPAAKVEEMYRPERFGLTETMTMTSLPLP